MPFTVYCITRNRKQEENYRLGSAGGCLDRWMDRWMGKQMGEQMGGIGGIALGWEIKPQINSLTRQDTEISAGMQITHHDLNICEGLLPAYISHRSGGRVM